MGLGKTLSGMAGRYLAELDAFFDAWTQDSPPAAPRILISGCADYSAFAHVLHAARARGSEAHITALDLCETPLVLNRWYADRFGAQVHTVRADILDYADGEGFDLILTSSFLSYFSPAARPRLFDAYARLLRERGTLIFANRLRAEREDVPLGFSELQAAQFAARAAQLSATLPATAAMTPEDAHRAALDYAHRFYSYPLNSAASIRGPAEAAGLTWMVDDTTTTQPRHAGVSGPTVSDGADYLFVRIQKPPVRDTQPPR